MHRPRIGSALLLLAFAATAIVPLAALPASAVAVGDSGCKVNDPTPAFHPGAGIGWYPAWAGSQSQFNASCVFESMCAAACPPGANGIVSSKFTIHDSRLVTWHNGAARSVVTRTATAPSATCIEIVDSTALAPTGAGALPNGWINHPISGGTQSTTGTTGIAPRTFITAVNACGAPPSVTLNTAVGTATGVAAGVVLHLDNSDSRSTASGSSTGGAAWTDLNADFLGPWSVPATAAETGDISGTNTADFATYTATGPTTATIAPATAVAGAGLTVTYRGAFTAGGAESLASTTREITDVSCTATTATSTAGFFTATDIGLPFYGCPAFTFQGYITAITVGPPSTATVSGGAMTVTASPSNAVVGDPSVTAPCDASLVASGNYLQCGTIGDESVLNQQVQLDLSPTLVAGSNDCALDEAEGFGIVGKWRNPGPGPAPNGFFTSAFAPLPTPASAYGAGSKVIGEILFTTAVVSYGAFVVERETTSPVLVPADPTVPNTHRHYDVVFGNVPTGLALCDSATSPGLGFSIHINSTTLTQAALLSGLGKPGTGQLRNTNAITSAVFTAGYSSTAYIYDDNSPRIWVPASRFNRLCALPPATKPVVNFTCGDG